MATRKNSIPFWSFVSCEAEKRVVVICSKLIPKKKKENTLSSSAACGSRKYEVAKNSANT